VAVDGVDVVAQPHAGVDHLHPRRRGTLGERCGEHADLARVDPLLELQEARRLRHQPPVDPAGDEAVVVVAAGDQQLAVGAERAPHLLEERAGDRDGVAVRAVAQLEAVAEDHQPVDPAHRLGQRRAHVRPPQQVGLGAGADVQVGDDQGPHGALVCRSP
jgi:hypothetical protein